MATRLKDNFKPDEPLAAIEADWLNTVARWLNTINVNGGPRFPTPFDLTLYLASGEYREPWVLDYSLNGKFVSLGAGHVFWGTKTMAVDACGPVEVTDDICWGIEIAYSYSDWGAAWVSKASITDFVDTDSVMRQFYYKFALSGSVASISSIGKRGNWKIPSAFAPE